MAVGYKHPTGTRAALNAKASAGTLVPNQVYHISDEGRLAVALTTSTYQTFAKQSEAGGGGGADPWTRIILSSDFSNSTVTFTTITGMTFTPPANSTWTIEAEILLQTAATASLPRLGLNVGAGQSHYAGNMAYSSSATAQARTEFWGTTALGNHQMAVGTAPVANQPYLATLVAKGRSGASPGAISLQLATETSSTITLARAGSEFRYR